VDYVQSVSLSDEKINILPKYYKYISGLQNTYGSYEGAECDFIGLESIIYIVIIVIDVDKDVYTLAVENRDALNKYVDCEMKHTDSWTRVRSREESITSATTTAPSKRGRPQKVPLVLVDIIFNTSIRLSTRLTK